jgi:hypothetical protein
LGSPEKISPCLQICWSRLELGRKGKEMKGYRKVLGTKEVYFKGSVFDREVDILVGTKFVM